MREIKFRLRIDKLIVGYEKWYGGADDGICSAKPQWLYSKDDSHWNPTNIVHYQKDHFTGLLDKNEKEIYEGDICRIGTLAVGEEPKTEDGLNEIWFYQGKFLTRHYAFPVSSWACNPAMYIEVVGNIHENPELLDSKKPK